LHPKPRLCDVSRRHLARDCLVATRGEAHVADDDEKLWLVVSSRAFRAMLLERIERQPNECAKRLLTRNDGFGGGDPHASDRPQSVQTDE